MTVTGIQAQKIRKGRYSVFIDGKYTFSLSDRALLESKLVVGQELDDAMLGKLRKLADEDLLYERVLGYVSLRLRSEWEVAQYLDRRKASPALTKNILNKLRELSLIDDEQFALAYIRDRQRLHPSSRRKMLFELKNKRIADEVIGSVLASTEEADERSALLAVIEKKRKESRYQDDTKLMQYLSRQGFSYGDIKNALAGD